MTSSPILLEDPRTHREHYFQLAYHVEQDEIIITECWIVVYRTKWLHILGQPVTLGDYDKIKTFDIWDIVQKLSDGYWNNFNYHGSMEASRIWRTPAWPGLIDKLKEKCWEQLEKERVEY
jgi:hypothetical protein